MPATPSLYCLVCGTENPATRQFCRKCASDLHAPPPDPGAAVDPEPTAVPVRPIVIGAGIALAMVIIAVIGLLFVLGGSPAPSPTPPEPTPSPSPAPSVAITSTPVATLEPTTEATAAPSPVASASPAASGKPVVDSLSGPARASCTGDNGTGTTGYIHLSWTASNTSGIRLSIDPPAPNDAYDYGYDDYPAIGSADVPFTCDPPNSDTSGEYHLYVATTLHDDGRYAWRYIKVYLKA